MQHALDQLTVTRCITIYAQQKATLLQTLFICLSRRRSHLLGTHCSFTKIEVVHNSMSFLLIAIFCDLAVSNSHGISWRSLPLTKACFLWLTFSSPIGIPRGDLNTHATYIHALNRSFSTIREKIYYRSQITIYCILCTKQLVICCLISL